jgi:hypothetical protein
MGPRDVRRKSAAAQLADATVLGVATLCGSANWAMWPDAPDTVVNPLSSV